MKWIRTQFLIIMLPFLWGCEEEPDPLATRFSSKLVVDGSIESGGFARVSITRNIPYYVQVDSADFQLLVIRQAKVTVSDGTNHEILTLKYNKNLFPPYYYQGTSLRGEPGKSYSLLIEHGDTRLFSNTTIPTPAIIDSAWFSSSGQVDTIGAIKVSILHDLNKKEFYRFYTRVLGKQSEFYPALLPNFDSQYFSSTNQIVSINKGPESYLAINEADFHFRVTDTVILKICTMDERQFEFWRSYQQEVSGGANPFAASARQVISNIEGGLGNWAGYGVAYRVVEGKKMGLSKSEQPRENY